MLYVSKLLIQIGWKSVQMNFKSLLSTLLFIPTFGFLGAGLVLFDKALLVESAVCLVCCIIGETLIWLLSKPSLDIEPVRIQR